MRKNGNELVERTIKILESCKRHERHGELNKGKRKLHITDMTFLRHRIILPEGIPPDSKKDTPFHPTLSSFKHF